MAGQAITVCPLDESHRAWAIQMARDEWASQIVISRGVAHDVAALPGFVALLGGEPVGLLTYHIAGDACEIVTLNSQVERRGAATALIEAARAHAQAAGCRRLWLITTNDNFPAIRFYQKRGFYLVALYPGAVNDARRIKPDIPFLGMDDIPIRDELEFEIVL